MDIIVKIAAALVLALIVFLAILSIVKGGLKRRGGAMGNAVQALHELVEPQAKHAVIAQDKAKERKEEKEAGEQGPGESDLVIRH